MSYLDRVVKLGSPRGGRLARIWRDFVNEMRSRPPLASTSFRFLARKIGEDFATDAGGRTLHLSSLAKPEVANDSILMLAWSLHEELKADVLIVDLNLKYEGLSQRVLQNGEARRGASDVLIGGVTAVEVPVIALAPGVSFLPSGQATEALNRLSIDKIATENSALFSHLRKSYDYILVQLGDVSSDTRVLAFAQTADLFLLLAEEGGSRMAVVEESSNLLREHNIGNVQLLLTTAPRSGSATVKHES